MKCVTFCRILLLYFIILASKGYGDITSYQTKKQASFSSKMTEPQESKCPSGGCYEGETLEADYPLLVFMSFSMPETALLVLAQELETYGGAFVIRGLPDNSFAEFFNKLNHLKDLGMDAPILIDPDSFEDYQITEVPTTILKGEESFDKITGNVPISYALETFAEKGEESLLAQQIQRIPSNTSKQCKQSVPSIHSKQGIQNSRGSQ